MQTLSFLFFPFSSTVSPRNNCRSSILARESATTLLSSLTASSTSSLLGFAFLFRIAVASSSPFLSAILVALSGSLKINASWSQVESAVLHRRSEAAAPADLAFHYISFSHVVRRIHWLSKLPSRATRA